MMIIERKLFKMNVYSLPLLYIKLYIVTFLKTFEFFLLTGS